jgi:hypothetical protein
VASALGEVLGRGSAFDLCGHRTGRRADADITDHRLGSNALALSASVVRGAIGWRWSS